jgi:hypothetical protein
MLEEHSWRWKAMLAGRDLSAVPWRWEEAAALKMLQVEARKRVPLLAEDWGKEPATDRYQPMDS